MNWLDSRTGYKALISHLLDEPVRGGASWAYVFGSLLLFVLINQALTGVLLMAFYAPSATDAWASVAYIQDQVQLGWFIRGMHSSGASVMVLGMAAHLGQVALFGAYRAPREASWLSGLFLLLLVLGFALTGYLLPWDQKGYWATQVATSLLGATPLVGETLQTLVQGGSSYGNLTLTHFYSLHVFVLPAIVAALVIAHVALFRRHGVTPRWGRADAELTRTTTRFWPSQAVRDLVVGAALLGLMALWVSRTHGTELSAPADPASRYDARPEWYFLPLYQLLKYFPGQLEIVAALGAPALFLLVLFVVPFIDRARDTTPTRRVLPLVLVGGSAVAMMVLAVLSRHQDATNPKYRDGLAAAQQEAQRARRLALQGVPAAGGTAVYLNDPLEKGRLLFREHCQSCHQLGLMGPPPADQKGPDLTHFGLASLAHRAAQRPRRCARLWPQQAQRRHEGGAAGPRADGRPRRVRVLTRRRQRHRWQQSPARRGHIRRPELRPLPRARRQDQRPGPKPRQLPVRRMDARPADQPRLAPLLRQQKRHDSLRQKAHRPRARRP